MTQTIAVISPQASSKATTPIASPNINLYWDLNINRNKLSALHFFKQLTTGFCVYSPNVEKLYSHFEVVLPKDNHEHLIILPNPYIFNNSFNHINEKHLINTGILLLPGECLNKKGIIIAVPKNKKNTFRLLPLHIGGQVVINRFREKHNLPFLPVLLNPDLRGFQSQRPFIHLFRLRFTGDEHDELPLPTQQAITKTIHNKLTYLGSH
ncbi:hypothetical protein H0A36_01710 [Endozoicomonas sp. SM1973]|uniref:Uncharacterized protein n=1 Tax=Spartinivicinus marinus TaxID=2994442 RepID=A0A853I3D5_9GAMM|nr:hypothetical protein [Spartinivicinus marinus]MCX4030051.1 hypothetical protein [Spartinivicinus marinus]NYZ64704.1 hypothetical protein [Spartinivicinus marinus]